MRNQGTIFQENCVIFLKPALIHSIPKKFILIEKSETLILQLNLHHTTSNLLFVQFDISITSRLVSHDYRLSRSTQQMELIYKRGILKFMFLFTACKNQFESRDQVFLLMLRFFSVIIRYIFFSFCLFSFFLQLL